MRSIFRFLANKIGFNPVGWVGNSLRMRRLIREFRPPSAEPAIPRRFAVVIAPWVGSDVPLFSLATGILLAARGNHVTFILDDIPFGGHRIRFHFILACIKTQMWAFKGRYAVLRLTDFRTSAALQPEARQTVDQLAHLNAIWALRGEMTEHGRKAFEALCAQQLSVTYPAVASIMKSSHYDVLFVPGGVYGNSGLWFLHARAAGVRVATYDSGGYMTLMVAADGIASQLRDIPHAFELLKNRFLTQPNEQDLVVTTAMAEIDRRRAGTDSFESQMRDAGAGKPEFDGGILVALNSSWDSAALGLHTVFESNKQWIVETVRYLLDNAGNPVIVRQHPAERLEIARTSDDYRQLLERNFGAHPRLHFIAAQDPINSYQLLEQVVGVVVYTSTIGIESAIRSKPVVTASNSYYSDLGFVWKARDLDTYQRYLGDAAQGRLVVSDKMREDALYCYYLTQCRNWIFTAFNPSDFKIWGKSSLDQLLRDAQVRIVLECLEENTPAAFLNHVASVTAKTS